MDKKDVIDMLMEENAYSAAIIKRIKELTDITIEIIAYAQNVYFLFEGKYIILDLDTWNDYNKNTQNNEVCLDQLQDISERIIRGFGLIYRTDQDDINKFADKLVDGFSKSVPRKYIEKK